MTDTADNRQSATDACYYSSIIQQKQPTEEYCRRSQASTKKQFDIHIKETSGCPRPPLLKRTSVLDKYY
ncbi:E3 ubiquitin-protein ligase synoviolin-A [Trichinella spiralis]|uniref:E3 ubiquitin-protein ligase synoviolin-A n=1 Tax=Trichinella spiralis TaxID=6334 RepID=UPI0001EFBBC9|nr:E3 ubiquitin-protein ligase synoviolin-A [Trichinella spiralis]